MNPLAASKDIAMILPAPEASVPHDLVCFDPDNDLHILVFGASTMLLAAVLVFFCINCCRANSMHNMKKRFDQERASQAHRLHELKREVSHLRRDLHAVQFQETEDKIDRILQRAVSSSPPPLHLRDWERATSPPPSAPPVSSFWSASSGSPARGQLYSPMSSSSEAPSRHPSDTSKTEVVITVECEDEEVQPAPFTDQQPPEHHEAAKETDEPAAPSMITPGAESLIAP